MKKIIKQPPHSFKRFYKSLSALLILFAFFTVAMPIVAFGSAAPMIKTGDGNQDDFDKNFREARDLIDREDWSRAAGKFSDAIEKYPNAKLVDAAFYWLAFCYKKQKQFEKADAALDRLMEKFPASSWAADARVMKMEIAAPLGKIYPATGGTITPGGATNLPARTSSGNTVNGIAAPCLYESLLSGGCPNAARTTPLDREDEIKIAAFQSLLAADPKRAIETLGEILKTESKASETLKIEVLRVVRSPRRSRSETVIYAVSGSQVGKEFAPLLRGTLVKSFENETNIKIRKEIIYALANSADTQSINYLEKLYAAENDREMKRAIINAFSPAAGGFYVFETNSAPKRIIESDILWEIVRTEKDLELRLLAFANLQRFQNWAAGEQTVETLARLYYSESDEAFRISIVRAFAGVRQSSATRKLLDIAKNDKSDKLRLEAIYSLRNSKDPEALKFLEELIK